MISLSRSLDTDDKGFVLEEHFRKLLTDKQGVVQEDVDEMIKEYQSLDSVKSKPSTSNDDEVSVIYYEGISFCELYFIYFFY